MFSFAKFLTMVFVRQSYSLCLLRRLHNNICTPFTVSLCALSGFLLFESVYLCLKFPDQAKTWSINCKSFITDFLVRLGYNVSQRYRSVSGGRLRSTKPYAGLNAPHQEINSFGIISRHVLIFSLFNFKYHRQGGKN